jgi:ABC-type cobalamin/Fe3+-siderophores transport system ATPase subunit
MRLTSVFIDGYKNLKNITFEFDSRHLTTVLIGQNGSGKSNFIEAIVQIFRYVDINRAKPHFDYRVEYKIDQHRVVLIHEEGKSRIVVDDKTISRKEFDENKESYFPDLVFGYYSGSSRTLESLFDSHQRRYYDRIKINENPEDCVAAKNERRLFYCRPIHGVMALISFLAKPEASSEKVLKDKLGIESFDSLLALFHEPWYAKGGKVQKLEDAKLFWRAKGPAGKLGFKFKDHAHLPLTLEGNAIEDYRDKQQSEAQYACFIKDLEDLRHLFSNYKDDIEAFYALEAADISDLFRQLMLWVKRVDDQSGDVSFSDLSDGERQLLMVLGLLRVSRKQKALFFLDEPDTHLNPAWQHAYLDLIQEWTGRVGEEANCQIILTSHNPLTISALEKSEVRIIQKDEDGVTTVTRPYADPKGMGFTATLTEIFGLPTTLDSETQAMVDERNVLAKIDQKTTRQEQQLIEINDKLNRLGFMFEDREPLYQDFLRAWQDVRYAGKPPLNQEQIEKRQQAMANLIKKLTGKAEI